MAHENQGIAKENLDKWQILGHEPVHERGVVRLKEFRKTFSPDVVVKEFVHEVGEWAPVILKSTGEMLHAVDILPERADIALDEQGRVLPQGDFESRYKLYLEAWVYPEEADPNFEPIPNVIDYICEEPDSYSESRGYLPLKFDPKLNQEFKPKEFFGPDGETEEEWRKKNGSQAKNDGIDPTMKAILDSLSTEDRIKALERMAAAQGIPLVGEAEPAKAEEAEQSAVAEAPPVPSAKVKEIASCGAEYTQGYYKQHARFCKDEDCTPASNSVGREE